MSKEKYFYNKHTLTFEKVRETLRTRVIKVFAFLSAVVVTAILFLSLAYTWFPSPHEKTLISEIDRIKLKYQDLTKQYEEMSLVLENIQDRDAYVHRMLLGMDPIDKYVWTSGTGGHTLNKDLVSLKYSGSTISKTQELVDQLRRKMVIQSMSLDTLMNMAKNNTEMLRGVPAIKPVSEDKLQKSMGALSGFGYRIHPIFKVRKFHSGIDFPAPKGTHIQATGDGVVVEAGSSSGGYGRHVMIDHGFGYKTLYGHMDKITVTQGQRVKRGQKLGNVGSTGRSTAPHLHYEVHYKGAPVDPIHYVVDGLSPEQYRELIRAATNSNMSLD